MTNEENNLQLLKQGDERAWQSLYRQHYVVLCQQAYELLGDTFEAETVVEDTIFHVWEIRETLQIETSLRKYLMRAVQNRCLNRLESERVKRECRLSNFPEETFHEQLALGETDDHPLGRLLEKELEAEIRKAVAAIPEPAKQVFLKSRFDHKKNEEIATELGISVNTVKYHLKKALSSMREYLAPYLDFLCLLAYVRLI